MDELVNEVGNKRGLKAEDGYQNSNPPRGANKRAEDEQRVMESIELHKMLMEHKSAYTKDQRIEAAKEWFAQNNLRQVGKNLGIAYETLRDWKDRPWWPLAIRQIAKERDKEFDAKATQVMNEALVAAGDRVKNGDLVLDKNGELVRKPLSGRDLTAMIGVLFDKRSNLRGHMNSEVTQSSDNDKFKMLENKFKEISQKLQAKEIDGEFEVVE